MNKIRMVDEVHCKANASARAAIKPALVYDSQFWRRGQYSMEQEIKKQHLITGRGNSGGHFLTGLLPRIKKYCKNMSIDINISTKNREKIKPDSKPNLNGITFRKDQLQAIQRAKRSSRGIILASTGSGKTITALGIISMFKKRRIIFVVHTKDLYNQTVNEANKFKKDLPPIYTPQGKDQIANVIKRVSRSPSGLIICLIQSLSKVPPSQYIGVFDVTIIDESHNVVDTTSSYGKFMQQNLSPRRYGFTATLPTTKKQLLVNEGLIGPVLYQLTSQEGVKVGINASANVELYNVPYNPAINAMCKKNRYAEYYKHGIIYNKKRNAQIKKVVKKAYKNKSPVLVIIEKIEHGNEIQKAIQKSGKIEIPFIHGQSSTDERDRCKRQLINGEINGAIVSRIWMEGINIPNLEVIVYAPAMKEKKKVIQAMGRGLRTTETKKEILLIDFLDPYRYLAHHAILRIQVYNEEGWL